MDLPKELLDSVAQQEQGQDPNQVPANMQYSHKIVSRTGYLLGVSKNYFHTQEEDPNRALFIESFEELEKNKHAKILRNLCIIRTSIERNFKKINNGMHKWSYQLESYGEEVPQDSLAYLRSAGIHIPTCRRAVDYIIEFNRLIQDKVNNCHNLYEAWIDWNYIRSLFIMPDGLKELGTKKAAEQYYNNLNKYPYRVYANVKLTDEGNILYNDDKFLKSIYRWNHDEFGDKGHVTVLNDDTKNQIYDFLDTSQRIVIVVDCENSDPFRLHAVLDYLGTDSLSAVEKILLFNDENTTIAWDDIGKELNVPVNQIFTERVLGHKSLVDGRLIGETTKERYRNQIDSFILVSSDSDYSALINTFEDDAHFLVMLEREHCSPHLLERLHELNTPYCFMEDFPFEQSDELKEQTILREIKRILMSNFNYNLDQLLADTVKNTRAEISAATMKNIRRQVANNIRIDVEDDGSMHIELNRIK